MRTDLWAPAADARLTVLWGEGLSTSEIARMLNQEFGTQHTKCAVVGRRRRLNLPSRPSCIQRSKKTREAKGSRQWTAEQRAAAGTQLARYWRERKAAEANGTFKLKQKTPETLFESVEQFLARGGRIHRIEPRLPEYAAGVPVFPTGARHYAGAP